MSSGVATVTALVALGTSTLNLFVLVTHVFSNLSQLWRKAGEHDAALQAGGEAISNLSSSVAENRQAVTRLSGKVES